MYSAELVSILNKIANDYAAKAERSIKEVVQKFSNTGAGVDSVKVDVLPGNTTQSPRLIINIADHLLVLNKRKPQWTKQPNMKQLLAWAETKTDNVEHAKKLAFATAYNQRKFDKWKPKYWRKKSLSEVLKEMNAAILIGFDEAIETGLAMAVKI